MVYALAIAALAVLIVVHEFGHMWVARRCGMRVEKFSIFFGPVLWRWKGRQTTYQLASIPLGGYVQIAGMNPEEALPADDPGSYQHKPAWQRFLTILAGPGINYVFAIGLIFALVLIWGQPRPLIAVAEVMPGSPALQVGLRAGDVLRRIDGVPVKEAVDVTVAVSSSGGRPMTIDLVRGGRPQVVRVAPRSEDGVYRIGIRFAPVPAFERVGVLRAAGYSLAYPVVQSAGMLRMLGKLATREVSAKQVEGPVGIVHQLKLSFESGAAAAVLQIALLSVCLGLFNLLPLPALDGGRLVFLAIEIVTRRRVSHRVEALIHTVGFVALFGLLLLVTYSDLRRRFG
ncbi:MAG: site-2 protease family protein [Proteobacteria bacterium]|nr:site-2 protease family protein [Pseudomonadota bacterium]